MISTDVVYLSSSMAGAPTLAGINGAAIDVLTACLVDGFNPKTVTITRTGSVATATCNTHGFVDKAVIKISSADQAEYNGRFRITNVTANTFDYTVSGSPVTPATGTIEARYAPAQWTRPYNANNIAGFRNAVSGATGKYLQVKDDSSGANGAKQALCRLYDAMTDEVTGTGPAPTVAQLSNGIVLNKSTTANSTARTWIMRATPASFFLAAYFDPNSVNIADPLFVGDMLTDKEGDNYAMSIVGSYSTTQSTPGTYNYLGLMTAFKGSFGYGKFKLRSGYDAIETAVAFEEIGRIAAGRSGGGSWVPNPNPTDNGFHIAPMDCADLTTFLGRLPYYQSLHAATSHPSNTTIVSAPPDLAGRRLMVIGLNPGNNTGYIVLDLDGPDA